MTRPDLDWELCRSFLAVMREGSLSRAGRVLGLTQPTLGRHIDELEATIATPLFVRSRYGLTPTDAAVTLLPHAEAMASAADAFVRNASGTKGTTGTIRITAGDLTGAEILPPILAAFQREHPGVVIELLLSDKVEDLVRRDADIAVRMVRPTQGSLIARRIGQFRSGLAAHRSYIERRGLPTRPEDLAGHVLVGFDKETPAVRGLRAGGLTVSRDVFAFRSDSGLAQLAAVRAGYGIGSCPYGVLRREPDLLPVLPAEIRFSLETWVVMHEDERASERLRLMFRHLVLALTQYAAANAEPPPRPLRYRPSARVSREARPAAARR